LIVTSTMPRLPIATLTIPYASLGLDESNPRLEKQSGQLVAISAMIKQQGEKIVNLAADITEHGLSAAERFMAIKPEEVGESPYIALDGNRRLVALNLLHDPALASGVMRGRLYTRLCRLADTFAEAPIEEVEIALFESREQAALWVARRHSANMNGVGQDGWEALDKQRFDAWRGYESREWQILETVRLRGTLSQQDITDLPKLPITTLKRLIADRYIKTQLGLEYHNGRVRSTIPGADIIPPLQRMVLDLLHKRVDVTHLPVSEDRRIYFDSLEETAVFRGVPLPAPTAEELALEEEPAAAPVAAVTIPAPAEKRKPRLVRVKAPKTVILPSGQLGTAPAPVQALYYELQRVDADACPLAGALLLSTLLTVSLDHYLGSQAVQTALVPPSSAPITKLLAVVRHVMDAKLLSAEQGEPLLNNLEIANLLAANPPLQYTTVQEWPESLTGPNLRSSWAAAQPLLQVIWS